MNLLETMPDFNISIFNVITAFGALALLMFVCLMVLPNVLKNVTKAVEKKTITPLISVVFVSGLILIGVMLYSRIQLTNTLNDKHKEKIIKVAETDHQIRIDGQQDEEDEARERRDRMEEESENQQNRLNDLRQRLLADHEVTQDGKDGEENEESND